MSNVKKIENAILGRMKFLPDEVVIKAKFKNALGYELDLDNPQTFNEKLQWLKLHDRKDIYTTMVDKYEAKKYVADKIGEEYIIPTLGVYNSFDEIDFEKLPEQFVIKCTHNSGGIVICKDKNRFDKTKAKRTIGKSLRKSFYYYHREWPYKNVKPRIIVEKYMEDEEDKELRDYKFFCFDGKCKFMFIATNRHGNGDTFFDFFDESFEQNGHPNAPMAPHKPVNFERMKRLAEKMSVGIPQIRVDFYEVNGKIYFGEMTFFHWSGLVKFEPGEWDYKLGKYINLEKGVHGE